MAITVGLGTLFVNVCFFIEFLVKLYQQKLNELDELSLDTKSRLFEVKSRLIHVVKLQVDIRG